jgi:hypothetical protein
MLFTRRLKTKGAFKTSNFFSSRDAFVHQAGRILKPDAGLPKMMVQRRRLMSGGISE